MRLPLAGTVNGAAYTPAVSDASSAHSIRSTPEPPSSVAVIVIVASSRPAVSNDFPIVTCETGATTSVAAAPATGAPNGTVRSTTPSPSSSTSTASAPGSVGTANASESAAPACTTIRGVDATPATPSSTYWRATIWSSPSAVAVHAAWYGPSSVTNADAVSVAWL